MIRETWTPTRAQRAEAALRVATGASQRADQLEVLVRAVRAGQVDPTSAHLEALGATAEVMRLVSGAATMELAALAAPEVAAPPPPTSTRWDRLRWLLWG